MKEVVHDYLHRRSGSPAASTAGGLLEPPMQQKVDRSPRQREQQSHLSQLREASSNAHMPIQRKIAIPPFNGANPVSFLPGLPASATNYTTQARGDFTVPSTSSAWLGAYKAGSGAINTNLTFALQSINDMRGGIYERCHLLANGLGGEGVPANIVPGTKAFNAAARDDIEMPIMEARSNAQKRFFNYTVTANYGAHANANLKPVEKLLPTSFGYTLREYHWNGTGSSTDFANWAAQAPLNLGADAVKQNDLSRLAALHGASMQTVAPRGALDALIDSFTKQVTGAIKKIELSDTMRAFIGDEMQTTALQAIASDGGRTALPREVTQRVVDYMDARTGAITHRAIEDELTRQTLDVTNASLTLVNDARRTLTEKLTYVIGDVQHVDRTGVEAAMTRIVEWRTGLLERCGNLIAGHAQLAEFTAPSDLLNDFAADVFEETSRVNLYS